MKALIDQLSETILDAPQEKISALSGKLGMLPGVSSKTVYSKLPEKK